MNNLTLPPRQRARGGKILPALCNLLGTLILLAVIASCLPLTVPRLMGYQVYNVVSPSMEPAIPTGSVIYVKPIAPETLTEGDVIAFTDNGSVVCHRVVRNQTVEGEISTKGDANAAEDLHTVLYAAVIGRVERHYPLFGALMELYTGTVGKVYLILLAACGAMLNLLASRMRARRAAEAEWE